MTGLINCKRLSSKFNGEALVLYMDKAPYNMPYKVNGIPMPMSIPNQYESLLNIQVKLFNMVDSMTGCKIVMYRYYSNIIVSQRPFVGFLSFVEKFKLTG